MKLIWSIKDLVEISKERQKNKFDVIIAISGARGNGKSTFLFKYFSRFKSFNSWKHQIYSRNDVMKLLEGSEYSCIFDDEAIRTGYKRNFYDQDQKLLIQMLNMYRDNFNIYGLCVPNFYSLDKDLRDLVKIHVNVIERGLAVLHLPNEGKLYSDDMWDVKYNRKIEERWAKHKTKNPNFILPHHKLTTFKGYIHFGDLTIKQRELYETIKKTKRKEVYELEMKKENGKEETMYGRLLERLLGKELTKKSLLDICLVTGLKYSSVRIQLSRMLIDKGHKETLPNLLQPESSPIHNNHNVKKFVSLDRLKVI